MDWAAEAEADKIHLRPGVPPLMRGPNRELLPVAPHLTEVSTEHLMRELSTLIEHELWPEFERIGEGECQVLGGPRGFLKLALFRSDGKWAVVVHL